MRPDRKISKHKFTRLIQAGFFAAATVFGASQSYAQSQAQSAYDCRGLETHAALPSVEGDGGTFFTIIPELQSHHGLDDHTISLLSDLNIALDARGITLVLLPVPTRAQVLVHQLPPMAAHVGYDVDISTAVHIDMIGRLNAAGLTVADPLRDLRVSALSGERPFFETDRRPTTAGTRILAETVAAALAQHPDLADVNRGTFTSTAGAEVTLASSMLLQLQTACQAVLPKVITRGFTTLEAVGNATDNETDEATIIVMGTDTTATKELNLLGFLSEASGLETFGYGVTNGGAFAAISSYFTLANFHSAPPSVLVWEFPVSASLANHGDQPLRELVAAAKNMCERNIPVTQTTDSDSLQADLSQISLGTDVALLLDSGGVGLPFVRFHFTGADGLVRTRSIYRHPDQVLTGRFYLPLSGLNMADLRSVEIEGTLPFGLQSQLSICS